MLKIFNSYRNAVSLNCNQKAMLLCLIITFKQTIFFNVSVNLVLKSGMTAVVHTFIGMNVYYLFSCSWYFLWFLLASR